MEAITLSHQDLDLLGYFVRDLRELMVSPFMVEGGGRLGCFGKSDCSLKTASTDDEIRSFVVVFRRFYMEREFANYGNAVRVFATATAGHPLSEWVAAEFAEYERKLGLPPEFVPGGPTGGVTFTQKRLIDVFLYTKYIHQPDPRRVRQFGSCLSEVKENSDLLTWLFLTAIWDCAISIRNAGRQIARFYERYCEAHGTAARVVPSAAVANPGLGQLEKSADRTRRIVQERVAQLARELWDEAGAPTGGPEQFMARADSVLRGLGTPTTRSEDWA